MSRQTWVWDRTQQKPVLKQYYREPSPARSDLPCPMVISDQLDGVVNPVNGKPYDSKRAYAAAVRAAGCEIIGNEQPSASARPQMDDPGHDIKQAVEQFESSGGKV